MTPGEARRPVADQVRRGFEARAEERSCHHDEELLAGKKPEIPNVDPTAFKKAQQEEVGKQAAFDLVAETQPKYGADQKRHRKHRQ
jgi:hypothetical protein